MKKKKKKKPYLVLWDGHILYTYVWKKNNTLQPLYNTVRYNMVLDVIRFKDGSQKCIDYIEKWP